ncbi:hypothetical protein fugu_011634 [Takifugu bimaculatus]|uniref:CBM21 domain-containing protein n=2 Tax=Takifugu TaxID=31032 RepID=A0A4Z2C850_9TELE|nr:hypothetical protein fugu_011634 [Takifugu bimaculatus]
MEFVGQSGSSGAYSLLGVPGLSTLDLDVDDDDGEFVIGIRPKSSPLPRRRSSVCDEDSEPEPPPCGSRRVSFADAKGQSLVQVKEFDSWDVPKLPGCDCSESSGTDEDDYFLFPLNFCLPLSAEELSNKVQAQKVDLETIELIPGTTILKGVIRVLNICFSKAVYIRTTLDSWSSHFDLLAEHIPGSSDNLTDCFSFKLTLVPPFGEQGARVDFCLRYETPAGTFWANNNSKNYVLVCQKRVRSLDKPQWENANKKSCLKTAGQTFSAAEIVSAEDSCKENMSQDVLRVEGRKAAVKTKKGSDDQPGTTHEKEQELLRENQHNRIQRTQRQAARMARVKRIFTQRDGGANELQRDEPTPQTQMPGEETPSEVPEITGSSKSQASLKTCKMPALVINDVSQPHETCNTEPQKSESFDHVARGGEGDADIRDNPSPPNDYTPAESQNDIGTKPTDHIIPASSSENGSRFGTVVAPLYQQVFCTAGSERPTVRDWGNPSPTTTNLIQIFPLADGKNTRSTKPAHDGDNKDKIMVTKTEDSSHKSLKSSTNEEGEKRAMVEESRVVQNVESLKVPEILSEQSSNKFDVLKTVLGDKVVHPQTPNSLNPNFSAPELFAEGLNLWGETQERDVTNDLQEQSTAGTAQDPRLERPCQVKSSTCETQGQSEEQLLHSLEISLQTPERAPECLERDSGSGGHKSLTFHGKAQEEKAETMWVCRPMPGDALVKQDDDIVNSEETNENIVSTDEELSFTIGDTEVSDEDRREQIEDSETMLLSENKDSTELEMETMDNNLIEVITAAGEEGKDKIIQDTLQEIQETGDGKLGEAWANKQGEGVEKGSLESPNTSQEEKRTIESAKKTKDEQDEMGSEKENHTAETFQVNIERKNVLEQEEDAVIEEEFMIQWNNSDDHKAQEMDENVHETNPGGRGEVLLDFTSEPESMAVNEQENGERCSDARLNITDNKGEDCSYAPESDVQHKQECDKENTEEEQSANMANETLLDKEEAFHNNTNITHDLSKAEGDEPEHAAAEEWPCQWPEGDRLSPDDTSSESDSGDEVELYMRCLRAVHSGAQVQKDKNRDAGSNVAKSPNRGKLLSTPMPSISESADEEPPLGWHQDSGEGTAEIQTKPAALPETSEQSLVSTNVARWDTLNCENLSKTLLYATMLVSFVFLAFYYDFLACFGLYILSIIWLCCQSDRQPAKNNRLG